MEYNIQNDEIEIDLSRLMVTTINRWRFIVVFGIVGALLFGAISFFTAKPAPLVPDPETIHYYESTTAMEIMLEEENSEQLKAALELARSRTVLQRVIKNTNSDLTIGELEELVSVSLETQNKSSILEISVLNEEANQAKEIADKIRDIAKKFINNSMNIESFKTIEQANLPNEPIIVELIDDEIVELRGNEEISKTKKTSGNILKRLALGGLLGIFAAIFIIFIQFVLNDKIQTSDDVEKYLGKRVLASIPLFEGQKDNSKKLINDRGVRHNG